MTNKLSKVVTSYTELVKELQDKFNLSDSSARQIIAIVCEWMGDDENGGV